MSSSLLIELRLATVVGMIVDSQDFREEDEVCAKEVDEFVEVSKFKESSLKENARKLGSVFLDRSMEVLIERNEQRVLMV